MDLVKWIRKNNRKIMVFVVIFSMVSFVIGSYGIQIIVNIFGGDNQLIAEYDGQKIKSQEFLRAQNELKVLQLLQADRLLMSQQAGLSGPLMVHLLFRDSQLTGDLAAQLKQAVQQGQLPLSVEQIEDFFSKRPERAEILWILLKAETYRAGFLLPTSSARMTLQSIIPQLTGGQGDYAQVMSAIIRSTTLSEEQILRTFADLMSILSYAGNIMNNQAVTINQVRADVARSQERIDAEFVEITAADLVDPNITVADADLQQQFETYKAYEANNFTKENPYGFGYKLPKRVQLEYMVVPLDEVKKRIEKPTAEAVENYYSRNIEQYRSEIPSDPNDPESPRIPKTQPFATVEREIQRTLEEEKIRTLANQIFNEARVLTEKGFESINMDEAAPQEIQLKAGDYAAASKQLQEKYNVPVFTGKTGLLSPEHFSQRSILSTLYIQQRQTYIPLYELAFAVTEEKPERQRIGLPAIRVWENIGPFDGGFVDEETKTPKRVMALVRVIDIKPSQVPENFNLTYDTNGIKVFDEQPQEETTFALKEQIKKDVLLVRAMDQAKTLAEDLANIAKEQTWDKAIETYNQKYAAADVKIDSIKQQRRLSPSDIASYERYMKDNPSFASRLQAQLSSGLLTNELYSLLPADAQSTGTMQQVLAFPPQAAYYVVKEVVRQPATVTDYLENKAMTAAQIGSEESAGLTLIHFDPENILKRMDYELKTKDGEDFEVRQEENTLPSGEII